MSGFLRFCGVAVTLGCGLCSTSFGQVIITDQDGSHLFIQGTPAADVVLVWHDKQAVFVSLNGKVRNVTAESGVGLSKLYSVGCSLIDGDDIVYYQAAFGKLSGGTKTLAGATGNSVVMLDEIGRNSGVGIANWSYPEGRREPAIETADADREAAFTPTTVDSQAHADHATLDARLRDIGDEPRVFLSLPQRPLQHQPSPVQSHKN